MSFKYNDGDLLINNKSGCILVVISGDKGKSEWLTGRTDSNTSVFYPSIISNT